MANRQAQTLWPREHGAYAQLAVALAAAFALAPGARGLGQGILTAALFLASEPVLVLLGRRGEAAPGVPGRAWARLWLLGGLGALSLLGAWAGLPASRFISLLPPGLLSVCLFGLFLARRERTLPGEILAAWAFAAAALPMAVAGGAGGMAAARLAVLLGVVFTLGTALVHGHLIALRRGGVSGPRLAAFMLGLILSAAAWWLGWRGVAPRYAWLSLLPMNLAALAVWQWPPVPRRLKAVGWAAAGCALAGGWLAVACLRSWGWVGPSAPPG